MRRKAKTGSRLNTRNLVNRQHSVNRQCYGWWMDVPHLSGSRTFYDLMGLTHGTLNSFAVKSWGVLPRPGGFGSLMFDASSYVDCGSTDTRYNFTTENFTLAFWIDFVTLANSPVPINRGTYQTTGWYVFVSTGGQVYLQCEAAGVDNAIATTGSVAVINTWQHFILTRTGTSTGAIYLNGKPVSTSGSLGNCTSSTNPLQIGQYNGGSNKLNGHVDDVRIYGRGFSASDAFWLYNLSLLGYPGVLNRSSVPMFQASSSTLNGAAALIGLGNVQATGSAQVQGAAGLVGVSSLAAAGAALVNGGAALNGVGLLTPAGVVITQATAAMVGIGNLQATGTSGFPAAGAAMIGVAALSATGQIRQLGQAALSGVGNLSASGINIIHGGAALIGCSLVTANGSSGSLLPLIIISSGGGGDGYVLSGGLA